MEILLFVVILISIFIITIYLMNLNDVFLGFYKWFIRKIKYYNPLNWDYTIFMRLDNDDELFNL